MSISKKLIVTLNDDVATPNEKVYIGVILVLIL